MSSPGDPVTAREVTNSPTYHSDNIGKNTGDKATVEKVKHELGYVEKAWEGGDETARWGREEDAAKS